MGTTVKGGHAPSFKPITVDLDEEDQMIVDMKQQGYKDEDVVERLIEKGFTRYEPRSVNCRWIRIRKKTQEYEEMLLDEQLTDWHIGEVRLFRPYQCVLSVANWHQDEMLEESHEMADEKFKAEFEKLEQKRWAWTAQALNKRLPRQRFSAKACRQRFEALKDGTARCPPELDPNPAARALEREQRIVAFKVRKEEEAQRDAAQAEEKKRSKKDNTAEKVAARERKEAQDALKAQKKREKEEYRRSLQDTITLARERKHEALNTARAERDYNDMKNKFFTLIHNQLKKEVAALKKKKEKNGGVTPDSETDVVHEPKSRYTYKNTAEQIRDEDLDATEAAIDARSHVFDGIVRPIGTVATQVMPTSEPSAPTTNVNAHQRSAIVPDGFPQEPRSWCAIDELHNILRARGMLLNRMKETKAVILSRLNNEDRIVSVQQLRELLKARNEDSSGTKDDLMRRLSIADAKTSRKYQNTRTCRPLDERGNRIRVKMPVKPALSKTSARYNARDVVIKNGIAVTNTASPTTKKRAPTKKTPVKAAAKKTTGKGKSTAATKQFIPDDDDDDEEPGLVNKSEKEGEMQDIVSSMLSEE